MKQFGVLFAAAVLCSPQAGAQEVTLPLDRYEELRTRARPVAPETATPPAPFALEAAQVEVTAGSGSARVVQRLTLSIYAEDWVRVPLAAAGSLTSTQLGTLDGRIDTSGGIALVARGRGRHAIRIESVVPLAEDETATRVTRNGSLALPAAALVTGSLLTRAEVEEAEIVGGGMSTAAVPHRIDFVATPGATLFFQLRGAGRASVTRPVQALKVEAQAFTLARLARTRSRVEAKVVFEISNGEADTFALELPAGFDVVSVAPAEIGWVQEGARLKLTTAAPVDKELALEVALTGDPQPAFAAPMVLPAGVARVRLLSAVHVEADGIPEMTDPGSSRRAEPGETALVPLAAARLGVPVFVVRDAKRPPRWSVTWSESSALLSAQIDRLLVNALVGANGQAAYQLWADVRSSGATAVVIAPPPGLELVSVERDDTPVLPGTSEKGLVIPLGAGSGVQRIHLAGLISGLAVPEEGDLALPLPSSSAPFGQVEVAVRLPGDRSYTLANPERAGEIVGLAGSSPPPPPAVPRAKKAGAAVELNALVAAGATRSRRASSYFASPANSALVQARWSALTGTLAPLVLRVRPSREKGEWF